MKIGDGYQFKAVASRNRIIICLTDDKAPDKVFFRVVNDGVVHPATALAIGPHLKHGLWSEDMVFAADAERIYFLEKLNWRTVYELRLVDAKEP